MLYWTEGGTVASQQKKKVLGLSLGFLCRVSMFSLCLCGFSLGAPASLSPKTCKLGFQALWAFLKLAVGVTVSVDGSCLCMSYVTAME